MHKQKFKSKTYGKSRLSARTEKQILLGKVGGGETPSVLKRWVKIKDTPAPDEALHAH